MFNRKTKYDDFFKYSKKSDFVTDQEFFTWKYEGKSEESDDHFSVQCNLITGGIGPLEIDPKTLSFPKRLSWRLNKFCADTTAHGIYMISDSKNVFTRITWITLFVLCMIVLYQNARSIVTKYNRSEKIVDIELKFDSAPFPSVTVCNLNPYKASVAANVESIRRTLSAFDGAMNRAGIKQEKKTGKERSIKSREAEGRFTKKGHFFEPGITKCVCSTPSMTTLSSLGELPSISECDGDSYKTEQLTNDTNKCICAFDRSTKDAWPCYPVETWGKTVCATCDENSFCTRSKDNIQGNVCLCAPNKEFCVAYNDSIAIVEIWKHMAGIDEAVFLKAMGFEGMTDEVAIVTKAKENIMFAMAALPMPVRMQLSHSKRELIHKCSFGGKACDIENDFLIHVDPIFGSCFTFNHNRTMNLTSIKAGPMYGLRMIVYVNSSDYMPTTEATGVRLTIHDKEDFPFPDTFGYSAPTGFVSSFGLKLQKMSRLPAPYGDCLPNGKDQSYIYQNYEYSVEGCYRSCFQQRVLRACGCGDPRFPLPKSHTHCDVADPDARKCLESSEAGGVKTTEKLGINGTIRIHDTIVDVVDASLYKDGKCKCHQPCRQSTYSVTYSPARWPSESLQIQLGSCNSTPSECTRHYHDNGALIEVFYEQLNFEMLTETEAYGFVNLLADVGGQLGLWCGISFLSICEIVYLFFDLIVLTVRHYFYRYLKKRNTIDENNNYKPSFP